MERVTRINDCKVELSRCSDEEKMAMAEAAAERVMRAELELQRILDSLSDTRYSAMVMGNITEGESNE